ncbi:helix-turn-helix transcriptional regulator [Cellulomonas humilata]|uniref:ArsR family transcriptional regulator n=1 Tax=Cellulomonas humilata TaxID=144055 RepID=A0ABU0EI16_9CELL|nr:helix-turn-helix domain-containing protein [Cellulomonas humilata]MDQ0374921.1 putative ArsR family transcriptional regulator [Cellulomonas humilata]
MNATLPAIDRTLSDTSTPDSDAGTRQRVLQIVATAGPVSAAELAAQLDLAPAGIRRHLGVLEATDQITVHDAPAGPSGPKGRGRPARRYVVSSRGQAALSHRYSELASQALRFLAETAGPQAVQGFAEQRVRDLEERHAEAVAAAGDDVAARVRVLADGLTADGYAASARPVPGGMAMQLCQGHCPVQDVAHEFPALCEAEARAFSRLLGVHVQRLATLAGGGHVCTTSIPLTTPTTSSTPHAPAHHPVLSVEGHSA